MTIRSKFPIGNSKGKGEYHCEISQGQGNFPVGISCLADFKAYGLEKFSFSENENFGPICAVKFAEGMERY